MNGYTTENLIIGDPKIQWSITQIPAEMAWFLNFQTQIEITTSTWFLNHPTFHHIS